jgi:hypothetical protein
MERSFRDDVLVALSVLVGVAAGWLVFGGDDPSVLVASLVGVVIAVACLNVARHTRLRRRT